MWCNDLEYLLGHTACGVMTLSIIRSHCISALENPPSVHKDKVNTQIQTHFMG